MIVVNDRVWPTEGGQSGLQRGMEIDCIGAKNDRSTLPRRELRPWCDERLLDFGS